jgi:hypothetical protein
MTFEKIEHPAIVAARTIMQLHIDNIALIDGGFVFHDKEGNSVNDVMRAACVEQIELCAEIIATAKDLRPELLAPVELMLVDAKASIEKALEDAKDPLLPEIGNYDNDNPPTER